MNGMEATVKMNLTDLDSIRDENRELKQKLAKLEGEANGFIAKLNNKYIQAFKD